MKKPCFSCGQEIDLDENYNLVVHDDGYGNDPEPCKGSGKCFLHAKNSEKQWAVNWTDLLKANDGVLPAYAWPGGYPLVYYDKGGSPLCADCASKNYEYTEPLEGDDIHYEGPAIECSQCSKEIESAYGDPDEGEEA